MITTRTSCVSGGLIHVCFEAHNSPELLISPSLSYSLFSCSCLLVVHVVVEAVLTVAVFGRIEVLFNVIPCAFFRWCKYRLHICQRSLFLFWWLPARFPSSRAWPDRYVYKFYKNANGFWVQDCILCRYEPIRNIPVLYLFHRRPRNKTLCDKIRLCTSM